MAKLNAYLLLMISTKLTYRIHRYGILPLHWCFVSIDLILLIVPVPCCVKHVVAVASTTTSQLMLTGHVRCEDTSWSSVCPWTSGSCCSPDATLLRLMTSFKPSVASGFPWVSGSTSQSCKSTVVTSYMVHAMTGNP